MKLNEIIECLSEYSIFLPEEALKEAINKKEKMIPKLLDMLEYTKNNLLDICYEEDPFYGYIYAFFLLAQFKEPKAFPYLIDLLHQDEETVEHIIGDDYTDYLPRLLASTYNGDDDALFEIIENEEIDEFIRSCALHTFGILYLKGVKDRKFIVEYFTKLLNEKEKNDTSYIYYELFNETLYFRLIELEGLINITFDVVEKSDIRDLKQVLKDDNYQVNQYVYPLYPFYDYIDDTIGIMRKWQCFRYYEDEEFEESNRYNECEKLIEQRKSSIKRTNKIGRNDLCFCGSGKKYKKCCIDKMSDEMTEELNDLDMNICKAYWYLDREEPEKAVDLFRFAWISIQYICNKNNIKTVSEYDEKYSGYDFLMNWIQSYEEILDNSSKISDQYIRINLCNAFEKTFDLDDENNLYWKETIVRTKANAEFRIGHEEKATEIINDYLKIKPNWVWGYIEMSDWYDTTEEDEYYNLEKSKNILLKAEKIENIEDLSVIYERLVGIFKTLGDQKMTREYDKKWQKYIDC